MPIAEMQIAIGRQTTVGQGVMALIQELVAGIEAAIESKDLGTVQGVADLFRGNAKGLADAVLANTVVAIESATLATAVPDSPDAEARNTADTEALAHAAAAENHDTHKGKHGNR